MGKNRIELSTEKKFKEYVLFPINTFIIYNNMFNKIILVKQKIY